MENQIAGMFSSTAGAERAREQLLAEGFAESAIELRVAEDEAGSMQGNFTVGDDPDVTGGHDYRFTFAHRLPEPGCCMVIVSAGDAAMAGRAAATLGRLGATAPGEALRQQ